MQFFLAQSSKTVGAVICLQEAVHCGRDGTEGESRTECEESSGLFKLLVQISTWHPLTISLWHPGMSRMEFCVQRPQNLTHSINSLAMNYFSIYYFC